MGVMPFGMRLIILWAVGNIPITAAAVLMITERIGPGIFRRMERKNGVPGRIMELVIKDMPMRKGMIRVMEISREWYRQAGYQSPEFGSGIIFTDEWNQGRGNSEDSVWWDSYWSIWNCYNGSWWNWSWL